MTFAPLTGLGDGLEFVQRSGRWADLERLRSGNPMYDATIEEIDGRRIRVGDHWLADFASCNYLGFDLEPEIMDGDRARGRAAGAPTRAGPACSATRRCTRRSRSGSPTCSTRRTRWCCRPSPTSTCRCCRSWPASGFIFLDSQAHKTIYDGSMYARGLGATVQRFRANDHEHLAELLRAAPAGVPKIVAMDGVNSMTGNAPDLVAFAKVVPGVRRPALRRRRARLRRDRRAGRQRGVPVRDQGQRHRQVLRRDATTTSCSSAASPSRTRRCSPSWPCPPG